MKKTKVLVSSLLTIAMSASLAVGGTYALFTSEDSVNIAVTSGKVAVTATVNESSVKTYSMDVEQTAGAFENGGSAKYDAAMGDLTLTSVTPGDKVTFTVDVTNESNVAIVYRVHTFISGELAGYLETEATFNGTTGAIKKDVSDWQAVAAQGTIDSIPMSIELPVDAPNEAQGKNATVSVTVEAVQGNGAAALIPEGDVVVTPENIDTVLANAQEGDTIALTAGYYDEIVVTKNGLTFTAEPGTIVGAMNVNARDNCTIDGIEFDVEGAQQVYNENNHAYMTLWANIIGTGEENSEFAADNLTVKNCTFSGTFAAGKSYASIAFYERGRANGAMMNLTVDNCVFDCNANYYIYGYYSGKGEHKITNNTFGNANTSSGGVGFMSNQASLTITGNTFYNCTIVSSIHSATYKDSVVTITNNNFVAEDDGSGVFAAVGLRYYTAYGATVVFKDNTANGGSATFKASYVDGAGYETFEFDF